MSDFLVRWEGCPEGIDLVEISTTTDERKEVKQRELYVDKHQLDEEWESHPYKFMEWADRASTFRRCREIRRSELITIMFESKKKPTISQQDSMINKDLVFDELQSQYKFASSMVESMKKKTLALGELVKLHLAGYYSTPKAPKDIKENKKKMTENKLAKRKIRRSKK